MQIPAIFPSSFRRFDPDAGSETRTVSNTLSLWETALAGNSPCQEQPFLTPQPAARNTSLLAYYCYQHPPMKLRPTAGALAFLHRTLFDQARLAQRWERVGLMIAG